MVKESLNNNNFLIYTMKMYNNPFCNGVEEFQEDMLRIKYIKRLLLKFKKTGNLKTTLILNHIIILQNMFGVEPCVRILFYKIPKDLHSYLKSFFDYLKYTPVKIPDLAIEDIHPNSMVSLHLKKIK